MKRNFYTGLLALFCVFLTVGCQDDETTCYVNGDFFNQELPLVITEADYNTDNTYYMLNDDESPDVYFDSGQRSFNVSEPLQIEMSDDHDLRLRFYSPRALRNVTVWAKIDGYDEEFRMMDISKVMPFQQLTVRIPFAVKNLTAYTRSGKKIRIMANPYLTRENIAFSIESDDPYWKCLQSIRCKWRIAFGRYSDTQPSWRYKMKASHTREAVAIALNMSYMFSSDKF